ncbi:MAG: magnesium and cobalt transport protein CorA [Chromatiales bacterium]|nr:magnesium and cobalt transport protein CorA [Chromatiales bacterium]
MIVNCVAYRQGRRIGTVTLEDISEVLKEPETFLWLGLYEPDIALLRKVQEEFALHDLAIEDALNAHQRPKLETYGDSVFIVLETAQMVDGEVAFGETHIFAGHNYIVTVRHGPSVSYSPVRQRCEENPQRLALGTGYALYAVMDAIVDNYQPEVDSLKQRFEELENQILEENLDRESITRIYALKSQLVRLRDAALPIPDMCKELVRQHDGLVRKELRAYFRDIEDHSTRIIKTVDSLREMLTTAVQVHLAMVTVGQNEVVKRLAGWGAILAIPTVMFSLYGMNFEAMPELRLPWAYPVVIGVTVAACGGLYFRLRRAGWL